MKDAWGNAYVYRPHPGGESYDLISAGSDGKLEPKSWDTGMNDGEFPEDGVIRSGQFHRSWAFR